MNKPESVLDTKTHNIIWYPQTRTDLLILTERLYLVLINKKVYFAIPVECVWRKESKKIEKCFDDCRELRNLENMRVLFVAASHQTGLDTRSKAWRAIKVGIKGRGRSGTSWDSNPAGLCCSSAHLVQCEPDEASSFTNPNVGPGTYASLRLKLDPRSSAIRGLRRRQNCSSPSRG